jgi:hypothetical protein
LENHVAENTVRDMDPEIDDPIVERYVNPEEMLRRFETAFQLAPVIQT